MADTLEQRPETEASRLRPRVLAMLTTPTGLRQAFFTAEILGPPLAKRRAQMCSARWVFPSASTGREAE
jgi:hypothetical protein